jgi:hypothetical protein
MTNKELRAQLLNRIADLQEQLDGPPQPDEPEGWRDVPPNASTVDLLDLVRELEEELGGWKKNSASELTPVRVRNSSGTPTRPMLLGAPAAAP